MTFYVELANQKWRIKYDKLQEINLLTCNSDLSFKTTVFALHLLFQPLTFKYNNIVIACIFIQRRNAKLYITKVLCFCSRTRYPPQPLRGEKFQFCGLHCSSSTKLTNCHATSQNALMKIPLDYTRAGEQHIKCSGAS